MSIQTKEVPEGTDLLDVAASEFDSYHVFAVVEGNTIQPVAFKSFGDIAAEELGPKDKLTLVDGSVIFFAPKN